MDKAQDAAGVVSADGRNHLPTSAVTVALATAFHVVGKWHVKNNNTIFISFLTVAVNPNSLNLLRIL